MEKDMNRLKRRLQKFVHLMGLEALEPVILLCFGDSPREQLPRIARMIVLPLLAVGIFLLAWGMAASTIETKYGSIPTPGDVLAAGASLWNAHVQARNDRAAFYDGLEARSNDFRAKARILRNRAHAASDSARATWNEQADRLDLLAAKTLNKRYSGSPTYVDQILTSLKTVFTAFVLASLVAVPLGILCGLNPVFMACVNPFVQIFKPVSPLAWLPIVMIVVSAVYTTDPREAWFEKSFISSAITVALCSLWPTLVNTALGVASIDKDYLNVARVLQLSFFQRVFKIVLPASLPLMFTGLRISLGVGWMVLIAAEMLAQNPGLGKFVWDMFQSGSSRTLAQILVAVFTIGCIGFLLDRMMILLQRSVSFDGAGA